MRLCPALLLLAACAPDLPGPGVALSPTDPLTADDLIATVTDAPDLHERRQLTYTVRWERDGSSVAELDGATTVPAAQTAKGQVWTAIATGTDDKERESAAGSAQVTIGDTAPIAESVAITPARAFTDTTLTAVPMGSDADDDPITWSYTWSVNGTEVAGVDGADLDGGRFAKHDTVAVSAVGTADGLSTQVVQSADLRILNSPPSVDQALVFPDPPTVADEVVCEGLRWSDADGDPEDYLVSWEVDGSVVSALPVLTGNRFRRGASIVCILTPFDGEDEGDPVRSDPVVAANARPTIAAIGLSDPNPRTADTLTAVVSGVNDADGDTVQLTYVWTVNGSEALRETTTATSASLPGTWFVKGDRVRATVTPHDGIDAGEPIISDEAVVVNTPPTAPEAEIDPTNPRSDDDLVCLVVEDAFDADGDALTYSVTWTRDGEAWEGETASTLWDDDTIPSTATREGEEWVCAITADDGEAEGPAGTSDAVEVRDLPAVGTTGSYGVDSGDRWYVCRADSDSAWVAADTRGTYRFRDICRHLGYSDSDAWGGTCGMRCGYCGTSGREHYDGGGRSGDTLGITVHWRCIP